MEYIPIDIRQREFYKHISYDDLMNLCETNKEFSGLCHQPYVWYYLLKRDFGIITNVNPKQTYMLYKQALDFLSQYYNLITLDGLVAFVTHIEKKDWPILDTALENNKDNLFSVIALIRLIQNTINALEDINIDHPFIIIGKLINLIDDMIQIKEDDINNVVLKGCQQIKKIVHRYSYVFYEKQLKIVSYNYDLAEKLAFEYYRNSAVQCQFIVDEIEFLILEEVNI